MASSPKPTQSRLRQHALDRALQPDVVKALTGTTEFGATINPDELATRIITVANRFETYLESAEDEA